ncbi:MAG: SGNH/GDSL hydrolase family protein [Anaerolineae bacterium]|nr:SGNH/GDSL hydrolase family protein [Anaerolineae bacterium]
MKHQRENRIRTLLFCILIFLALYFFMAKNESSFPYKTRILLIGGSITEGAGASSYSNSYAGLITEWMKENLSGSIKVKNISVGGTGSDYAAFRIDHDLHGFVPDVVLYEFAVNDDSQDFDYILSHINILLTKLKIINPEITVISVITTKKAYGEYYDGNQLPSSVANHMQVAEINGIPVIHVGEYFWDYVEKRGIDSTQLLPDGVHPNDAGHQIYAEAIILYLESHDLLETVQPQSTQYDESLPKAIMADLTTAESVGCKKRKNIQSDTSLNCSAGDSFSFEFSGPTLGFVRWMADDGGRLVCFIDGEKERTVDFWDQYSIFYNRQAPIFLARNLETGNHSITCTVTEEKPMLENIGVSKGNTVNILFMLTQ